MVPRRRQLSVVCKPIRGPAGDARGRAVPHTGTRSGSLLGPHLVSLPAQNDPL